MKIKYNWKKDIFSDTFMISDSNKQIGTLKKNLLSQASESQISNKKYFFKPKDIFNQETEIKNNENKLVGMIKYNFWRNKATVRIGDAEYYWQYKNIWNTKWEIRGGNNVIVNYSSINKSIELDSDSDLDLQTLTGLYIYNYYQQMMIATLFIILFPILMRARS